MAAPDLLDNRNVCRILQIHRSTMYRWIDDGVFIEPVIVGPRGRRYWPKAELLAWATSRNMSVKADQ